MAEKLRLLKEDEEERALFNRDVAKRYDGNVLLLIADNLDCWSAVSPQQGTYSQRLAIFTNELRKMAKAT